MRCVTDVSACGAVDQKSHGTRIAVIGEHSADIVGFWPAQNQPFGCQLHGVPQAKGPPEGSPQFLAFFDIHVIARGGPQIQLAGPPDFQLWIGKLFFPL